MPLFGKMANDAEVPEWVEELVVRMKHMETELDTIHKKKPTAKHLPTASERLAAGGAMRIVDHDSMGASKAAEPWEVS